MKLPLRRKWRALRADAIVWLRYGTTRPTSIRLPGCNYPLQINPADRRARKLLIRDAARGKLPKAAKIWRALAAHFDPTLVVDVGVNYGECLLGTSYNGDSRLFGFEANPTIFALLERSIQEHPNYRQIVLNNVLVSDESAGSQPFFVNPDWSGTGSAVQSLHRSNAVTIHQLPVSSLDDRIPTDASRGARCLFKFDIEGYESKAMRGFRKTLQNADVAVGLIEFDTHCLSAAGTDPAEFLAELAGDFSVYCAIDKEGTRLKTVLVLEDIPIPPIHAKSNRRHTDLILVKPGTGSDNPLPPQFTIA